MLKRTSRFVVGAGLAAVTLLPLSAAEAAPAKDKGEEPKPSPGWVVIEEDVFYPAPLWFEPLEWADNARYHYRRGQEKAAAGELEKAESALKLAAAHALPETKKALETAATDLHLVAMDLEQGRPVSAARLDNALAKASLRLSEWHFFKAKDASTAQSEERTAASHLHAAGRYLQHAANSARYSYGAETERFFERIDEYGRVHREHVFTTNELSRDLTALEHELRQLGDALDKAAPTK